MNCECFYVVPSMTDAKKVVDRFKGMNVTPISISKATKDFRASSYYGMECGTFKVKEGRLLVFAFGPYNDLYGMDDIAKRGFFINSDDRERCEILEGLK